MTGKDVKRPIRILHVVGRMDRGGTEALLMSLFRHVDRSRICFDFIEQTNDHCDYDDEILSLGGKIWRCSPITFRTIRSYKRWWIEFLSAHPEYYVIHGHSRGSGTVYLSVAKKLGRKTIIHCHSSSHGTGLPAVRRYIWQYPLRFIPDYYFACSKEAGYSQFGHHKYFTVIKNGIETNRFVYNREIREQVRKELGLTDEYAICNVARFVKVKNHEFLIQIFQEVKKTIPEAKLYLIGGHSDDGREERIRKIVNDKGLDNDVVFLGVRNDVDRLLQAMDLSILPSLFEGLPVSNIEAQAAGLPCVISKDVISNETDITGLVHYVSLNEPASKWAAEIKKIKDSNLQRTDTSDLIRKSGFDIQSTLEYLTGFYEHLYGQE